LKNFARLLLLFLAAAANAQEGTPLHIGRITVDAVDVYSKREASRGFFYRVADRLHVETHASVVRKFLLFHEGDVFSLERLQETERNLRAQHYLKSASVVALPPHDGLVDVVVTTQDAWSIAPETQAGSRGGAGNFGASISESNLFGLGKEAEVSWKKDVDRTRVGIQYQDPMILDGYWHAFVAYGRTTDGNDQRIAFWRPFYSFSTPWSTEVSFIGFQRDDRLYSEGVTAARFSHEMRRADVNWGLALNPSDTTANRIVSGLRLLRDRFETVSALDTFKAPRDRDYRYLFTRFEHAENSFVKLNFVNKDVRYEDFNLGRQWSVEGAVSPRAIGAPVNSAYGCASYADGVGSPAAFMLHTISLQSRFDGGPQNSIVSAGLYAVRRMSDEHPSTFVSRIVLNNAWRQNVEDQFFADGLTGLRGYRAHTFAGSRSLIINAEQRFYLGRELLQLYSPGVVGFVDAGNATNGSFRDLARLKFDAGVGVRIGLPRSPKNLLRLDLAYAMNRDPRGKRGFLISFSSGQAF
jgi:surface antigen Omp85-like protein